MLSSPLAPCLRASDRRTSESSAACSKKARLYGLSREAIRDLLLPLLELPGLKLAHKRLFRRVFGLYTSLPIDYIDAYHAALMESRKEQDIYSYDEHFDRVAGLRRLQP